ncbi:hypothetical protein [Agromyces larvae]|uniref:Capsular polysaccharide biosynthesis protein n=1 Tax=Agromyces larvae TaxID=2929802 RepID=A0ABY4BX38_9MICO|nr:hypothetical protein [Agromyces larvae]UOE42752.1 hypothetical protein MTO99_11175 [Agromyces larvae]
MIFREVLVAMVRRWYAVAAVSVVGVILAVSLVHDSGSYSTRTVVSFMFPNMQTLSPYNGTTDDSVIGFAASVAKVINNGREPASYANSDAPYYGAGVREGVLVNLPKWGGQWTKSYSRAEIELQIVGRSEEWVESMQAKLISRIGEVAEEQQASMNIPADQRINLVVEPLTKSIEHVIPGRTAVLAAIGALLAAVVLVSAWVAVIWERLASGRAARRRRRRGGREAILEGVA